MLLLFGFGFLWLYLLGGFGGLQRSIFMPSLVMFGFTLAGIWLGRALLIAGLAGTALIVAVYFWGGPWVDLWMAAVQAVMLIGGGLWLRRLGGAS